jgi:hypothetical protein
MVAIIIILPVEVDGLPPPTRVGVAVVEGGIIIIVVRE